MCDKSLLYHTYLEIKLAESGAVDVAALDDDNQQIVTTIPLADLTVTQVYQVFGDSAIAPPQQQYFALAARQKAKPPRPTKKSYHITSNIKPDGDVLIVAGKHGVKIDSLVALLKDMGAV